MVTILSENRVERVPNARCRATTCGCQSITWERRRVGFWNLKDYAAARSVCLYH